MENIDVTKEQININKVIGKKSESFFIEEDLIVPDVKPDILNTITTNGNVCIYKTELSEAKVKIDGTVNTYIMYLADDEKSNVRGLNTNIDFTHNIDFEKCNSEMNLKCKVNVKDIECNVLNGRKIKIKIALETEISIYSSEDTEIISNVNSGDDIQIKSNDILVNSLVGSGNTRASAKDTIIIDENDNLEEILSCKLDIINRESKVSYNKILAKAEVSVSIVYLTEDNIIKTKESMIPVMGFVDILNIAEDNICDLNYTISNIIIKPNAVNEHSIFVEAQIDINCMAYENKKVKIIQDLYSINHNIEYKTKNIKAMTNKQLKRDICNVRNKIKLEGINENKLYNVIVNPVIIKTEVVNNRLNYKGEIELNFIYSSKQTSGVNTQKQTIEFDFGAEVNNMTQNINNNTEIEIVTQNFIVQSDGTVDVNIDLAFCVNVYNSLDMKIIDEITESEENVENPYSIRIYFVKKQDSLWNIAKRFRSTEDDIIKMNKMEENVQIYEGQKLFIPRHIKIRSEV